MHSARAIWHARDFGIGKDFGAVCAALRCDFNVESRGSRLRGYDRTRLHEDGNGGTLCANCAGYASTGAATAAERSRYREAVVGKDEVFWREDVRVDADCDGEAAREGQLTELRCARRPAEGGCPHMIFFSPPHVIFP